MGARKTKLARGDRYGLLKATELAAEMIAQYERAREGAHELRVESLEEAIWDDIVATHGIHTDKWQVKRLLEPFDRDDASKVVAATAGTHGNATRLHFGVAVLVPVKSAKKGKKGKEFGLTELAQLCDESRKPGLVADDFEKQEHGRPAYDFVSTALGGAPAAAVVEALQRLWLHELGLETKLLSTAVSHLRDVFRNPEEVVKQLHNWFVQNSDGKLSIGIDLLYKEIVEVYGQRDPNRPTWIHLARNSATLWDVRGPLELDQVVRGAWGSQANVRLQLGAPPYRGDAASASLARLILHQSSRALTEAPSPAEWQRHGMDLCGGTLGKFPENPDLAFNTTATTPSIPPRAQVPASELAEKLASLMNDTVWSECASIVSRYLHEDDVADDLRTAMQSVWDEWGKTLAPSPTDRATFLRSMLATADEWTRTGFDVAVRTGRLRTEELARSTMVALAITATFKDGSVSVTLGASGGVDNLILGTVPAHVIALAAASHPTDRRPSRICDAPRAMLEKENGIAILASIGEAAEELFAVARLEGVPFHASDDAAQNYQHPGDPFPILTAGPLLRAAMKKGLAATKAHLARALGHMNDARINGLRQAIKRAPNGG